jgi:hypothetical protein
MLGCATHPAAAPKPILVLSEWYDWGGAGHPWPIEVRLIAYDDGLVIRQPNRNVEPLAKPTFVWQQRDPKEVAAWADAAKVALHGIVPDLDSGVGLPLHLGGTDIEYWDAEAEQLVRSTSLSRPCLSPGDDAPDELTAQLRTLTHPSFLTFCDFLLGQSLSDAAAWMPKTIKVELFASPTAPGRLTDLPAAWPRKWIAESIGHESVEICLPVGATPDHLTAEILDPESKAWSQLTGFQLSDDTWWIVIPSAAQISLPAALHGEFGPC